VRCWWGRLLMQAVSRPEGGVLIFEVFELLLEFILVTDAIVSFFRRWIGAGISEQVIHGI